MTKSVRMLERRAVEEAILAMEITMTTATVRRTRRAVGQGPGKGREQRIGRGKGRGRGMQWTKERGRGRETLKGKVLLNKPQGEMISLVPLLCSC